MGNTNKKCNDCNLCTKYLHEGICDRCYTKKYCSDINYSYRTCFDCSTISNNGIYINNLYYCDCCKKLHIISQKMIYIFIQIN